MRSVEERFWAKVQKTDSCWNWTAGKNKGYGQFKVFGKMILTHRFSYELHYGAIPAEMLVCHRCDNPVCVRPDHLFLGTHIDNMNDREQKGRSTFGVKNGNAKLTEEKVKEIRVLNLSRGEIAERYGVSQVQIGRIRSGKQWKHIINIANNYQPLANRPTAMKQSLMANGRQMGKVYYGLLEIASKGKEILY